MAGRALKFALVQQINMDRTSQARVLRARIIEPLVFGCQGRVIGKGYGVITTQIRANLQDGIVGPTGKSTVVVQGDRTVMAAQTYCGF